MALVIGQDRMVADWVAARIPGFPGFGEGIQAFGVARDGALAAGVVYSNWDGWARQVEMSCAAATPRWLTKDVVRFAFAIPFVQMGARGVYARTKRKNRCARKLLKGLGFREVAKVPFWYEDDDLMIYTLTKREWSDGWGR